MTSDAVVPAHRVLRLGETTTGRTPGRLVGTDPGNGIPMLRNSLSCLAATAIGAAMGALESSREAVSRRVTRGAVAGGSNRMAECATVKLRVAEAAASIDTARTILLRDVDARRSSCGPATSARSRSNGSGSRGAASPRLRHGDETIADKAAFVTSERSRHGMPQISPHSSPERRSAVRRFCCRLQTIAA